MHEAEMHQEHKMISVVPVPEEDPILDLGQQPIHLAVDNASRNHDGYLYD